MAWTTPRTWVSLEVPTASIFNTHVRDNLLETLPAKVTTKGDIGAATGANAIARVAVGSAGQILTPDTSASAGVAWASTLGGALIGTQELGAAGALTFSSITGTWKMLRVIVLACRANVADTNHSTFVLRLNGDSGSNYKYASFYHIFTGGNTFASSGSVSATSINSYGSPIPHSSDTASRAASAMFDIYNPSQSTFTINVRFFTMGAGDSDSPMYSDGYGFWTGSPLAAVSSITITPSTSPFTFVSGAKAYLYGVA